MNLDTLKLLKLRKECPNLIVRQTDRSNMYIIVYSDGPERKIVPRLKEHALIELTKVLKKASGRVIFHIPDWNYEFVYTLTNLTNIPFETRQFYDECAGLRLLTMQVEFFTEETLGKATVAVRVNRRRLMNGKFNGLYIVVTHPNIKNVDDAISPYPPVPSELGAFGNHSARITTKSNICGVDQIYTENHENKGYWIYIPVKGVETYRQINRLKLFGFTTSHVAFFHVDMKSRLSMIDNHLNALELLQHYGANSK